MRTIKHNLYLFDELSSSAKEKARDWFKEGFPNSYDWYDSVFDDAIQCAKILGIKFDKGVAKGSPAIFFSGFWNQGDGARYEGSYRYAKGSTKRIRAYAPFDMDLHLIADELQEVQRRNFYQLEANIGLREGSIYSHSSRMLIYVTRENRYELVSDKDHCVVQDALKWFADWIYKSLEKEYEYLMSDEQVDESIRSTGFEFYEDGEIYR